MLTLRDVIPLFAELALALAGFVGIASAFVGRERVFRPVERLRLMGVIGVAASALAGCVAYISASVAALSESHSQSAAALASLVLMGPILVSVLPRLWQRRRDADAHVSLHSFILVHVLFLGEVALFLASLFGFGNGWPIATAFSLQLLHGLWLFYLLLTREN